MAFYGHLERLENLGIVRLAQKRFPIVKTAKLERLILMSPEINVSNALNLSLLVLTDLRVFFLMITV